ncbi:MAG TPA: type I DNA topoisomerase, partial [candidate division Zixibacteria bacterium]|nr:type I DNA topoisomerase [candidate division Zixibacteria bacterium]
MAKHLVIVESPAKAKTIKKFLGKDFVVEASIGHIRDLPSAASEIPAKFKDEEWSRLGVNIDEDFEPLYVIPSDKRAQVKKLKDALKSADRLYLATDEDREGEAISWHLLEALKPDKTTPVSRLVFHEITKSAITEALEHSREIDQNLVQAQETRRVLDRLYGYQVSPILWRKVAPKLSAGRVQSVAVKLVVDREKERCAFVAAEYWDIVGEFHPKGKPGDLFSATLREVKGKKLASGKDFDPTTGKLTDAKLLQLTEADARKLVKELAGVDFTVSAAESKPVRQSPAPPFTTATLQQQASSRLGLSAQQTMRIAQSLYENGYITYMRTDSTVLAKEALSGIRKRIGADFGAKYLPEKPRFYKSKVKNAQEAHEAIRPAGMEFPSPDELRHKISPRELKLYDLIWRRTIACQMNDARILQTTVDITGGSVVFRATGKVIEFDGFLKLYPRPVKAPGENGGADVTLPPLKAGAALTAADLSPESHSTKPPARYTEASLIRELEALGIGRPSTYAAIIETILRREYVFKKGSALVPTFVAYAVVKLMESHFARLVDPEFTARMEDDLDAISRGELERTPYLERFYRGEDSWQGLEKLIEQDIDARDMCTIGLGKDEHGNEIAVRIGKWGPYIECGEYRARVPEGLPPDELTLDKALEILEAGASGHDALGVDTATGEKIYLLTGRFGPYLQLGERSEEKGAEKPKQKGLLPGMKAEDVTLEIAQQILALPRELGPHPETGEPIVADLGRYGPYLKSGSDSRSLAAPDNLLEITYVRAVEIFKEEKKSRFGRTQTSLRDLGEHPDREGVVLKLRKGFYGP